MAKSGKPKHPSEYQVGYRRPPAQSRFQKGQSGNPSGRPKGTVNVATVLLKTLRERVVINQNGRRTVITKLELSVKQMVDKAASGDLRAFTSLVGMISSAEQAASEQTTPKEVLSELDHEAMLKILKRYEKSIQEGGDHETKVP